MDAQEKKELIAQYKERKLTGGVYAIVNTETGKTLLAAETNLAGSRNKFDFSVKTNLCPYSRLAADWKRYGGGAFLFKVLDELEKKDVQDAADFKRDLDTLLEMRKSTWPEGQLY